MIKKIIPILLLAIGFSGCKLASVSYSFTGAQISPDVKTFSVDYFSNKTAFAPDLGSNFTEALKSYLRSRTNLTEVTNNDGDVRFEGQIVGFSQRPMEIQNNEVAASNRLTIEIRVKFTNTKDETGKSNFDSRFSHYQNYGIDEDYDAIEADLIKKIVDEIIEDVYNKAFVNW
ncbi:LPS assembly lipoprotein LptE [uncultured Sanguibacteroides sp.]|uniref:LptE family protein n=1 Tax=uncultured Sanguibacteroides sp. TaxID=1635151 RepID=UPI0025D3D3BD|nr:LPS assembly lipoprotein LptE [uncultured Sanguibacteroides sp.]